MSPDERGGRKKVGVCLLGLSCPAEANVCFYSRGEEWHEREPVEMRTFGSLLSSLVPSLSSQDLQAAVVEARH